MFIFECDKAVPINCFTASVEQLFKIRNRDVSEDMLFERGNGFLLKCNISADSVPCLTVSVEDTGILGARCAGGNIQKVGISHSNPSAQLTDLLNEHGELITWIDRTLLSCNVKVENFTKPFKQAIVINDFDPKSGLISVLWHAGAKGKKRLHKTMFSDHYFQSISKHESERFLPQAYYFLSPGEEILCHDHKYYLLRQGDIFFKQKEYREALQNFRKQLILSLNRELELSKKAAYRAAELIRSYHVLPVLHMLYSCLVSAGFSHKTLCECRKLVCEWRYLSGMLKTYSIYPTHTALMRIDRKLNNINMQTLRMWHAISRS